MTAVPDLLRDRQGRQDLRDRRIVVEVRISSHAARFVIRDDGRGFDPETVSRAAKTCFTDGGNRGTLLMCTLMDEVTYNPTGNEVTLVKGP